MITLKAQSLGGQATAKISRQNAINEYYKNPNKCRECEKVIEVFENKKVSEIRKKVFCNGSCAATFNNKKSPKRQKQKKVAKVKLVKIKNPVEKKKKEEKQKIIKTSLKKTLNGRTKADVFNKSINWQAARSIIQRHARTTFKLSDKKKCCLECGYDKHYEVCHKKSVSSFNDEANIVDEINNINNLVALCPNHHWEFDNGILKFENMEL